MSKANGEHGTCPTVRIKVEPCEGNAAGIVEINESDYDPEQHELVEGESAADASEGDGSASSRKKKKKSAADASEA